MCATHQKMIDNTPGKCSATSNESRYLKPLEVDMASTSELTAEKIKKLREKKKWTQAKLADAARVNVNTVYRLETLSGSPSFSTLSLIADALGVSVFSLIATPPKNKG